MSWRWLPYQDEFGDLILPPWVLIVWPFGVLVLVAIDVFGVI